MISVIITTYGQPTRLKRAINSVLCQSETDFEIIVVDDNNPNTKERNATEKLISEYTDSSLIYIKHNKNLNGASARNTGINNSKGEYICFLDNDDFYLKDRLKKSKLALEHNSELGCVYTNVLYIKYGYIIGKKNAIDAIDFVEELLIDENLIGTGSNIFIRREIMDKVKKFDTKFLRHQDLEFMLRVLKISKMYCLDEDLIVKDISECSNLPQYKKYLSAKKLYFKKFQDLIDNLPEEKKIKFYDYHYTILLQSALNSENKEYIDDAINNLRKIRNLTSKEIIMIKFNTFFIVLNKIKLKVKENYFIFNILYKIKSFLKVNKEVNQIKIDEFELKALNRCM